MDKIDMVFQMVSDLTKANADAHDDLKRMITNQRVKMAGLAAVVSTLTSVVAWVIGR